MKMASFDSVRQKLELHNQTHLLQHYDSLTPERREAFLKDLNSIDYARVNRYFAKCMDSSHDTGKVDEFIEPAKREAVGILSSTDKDTVTAYENEGLRLISQSKVAIILLAGGQGTRLGVPYPKGMYDVGLKSGKTLYQLQAERILRMQELGAEQNAGAKGIIPWFIMTSASTKEPTLEFFERHNFFGLERENVVLFEQNLLPCMTFEGKIILEDKDKIARAPDGNGGLYRALGDSGVIHDLERRGIEHIHVYCVDNVLVRMADPVFIGFSVLKDADCSAKAVEKTDPQEPVGVVCRVNGLYQVVEYSEISTATAERRNKDGRLTFNAGNICNHYFKMDFLKMVVLTCEDKLKHHVANKKIPYIDNEGNTHKPKTPNGMKMEKFVFDVFPFSKNFAVWEVSKDDEFSPLKNADGAAKDTPTTSREAVYRLHQRWVREAGGTFIGEDGSPLATSGGGEGNEVLVCEISPLISYSGENLEEYVAGKEFIAPLEIAKNSKGRVVTRCGTLH